MTTTTETVDVQVLHLILVNLVTKPEDVKVSRDLDEQGVLLSVIVSPQDMGIVIGRNGGMAMAIKAIMRAIGKSHKMNVRVQFLEPDGSVKYVDNYGAKSGGAGRDDYTSARNSQGNEPGSQEYASTVDAAREPAVKLEDDLNDFVIN